MQALLAEKIAWNKLNNYAADYFGSFDMIDQDELDRLSQEYQDASDYRKKLGEQYEVTVDADSWGMQMMKESAWLKNSATENLSGFGKTAADTAIDIGQNMALSPLLLLGPKAYLAGTVANASAEDMYAQTEKGRSAGDAMASGLLTAGVNVVNEKLSKIENPWNEVSAKTVLKAVKNGDMALTEELIRSAGFEVTRESVMYFMNCLADKLSRNPDEQLNLSDFIQNAGANKALGIMGKEIDKIWAGLD